MAAAVAVVMACCARGEPDPPAGGSSEGVGAGEGGVAGGGLVSSLNVQVEDDTVRLALLLTNTAESAQVLEFGTAQRFDFVVETPAGGAVWQWSAGMGFAQMVGADTLEANAARSYEAVWLPGGRSGRHIAVARVTSSNSPVELRTEFEIPER